MASRDVSYADTGGAAVEEVSGASPIDQVPLDVLTFAMIVQYNGYQYLGFQRQTATPRSDDDRDKGDENDASTPASETGTSGASNGNKRRHSNMSNASSQQNRPNKRTRKVTSATVQDAIESALHKWTNLSLATLRVRGAGRTDKGVHASGQVVAFDIPLSLLAANDTNKVDRCSNDSDHAIRHLREASQLLMDHRSQQNGKQNGIDATTFMDQWQIRRALTTRLPADIVIRSVRMWTGLQPFEPRKNITRKTYTYILRFRPISYLDDCVQSSGEGNATRQRQMHPICNAGPHLLRRTDDQNTVWLCPWPLDPILLHDASAAFIGEHDFINFVHKEERKKAEKQARDNNSTTGTDGSDEPFHQVDLLDFKVGIQEEMEADATLPPVMNATFTVEAKGFRRHMIRKLVGFVVDAARGVRSVDDIPMMLMKPSTDVSPVNRPQDESLASMVNLAPACGLCLYHVKYEHDSFV